MSYEIETWTDDVFVKITTAEMNELIGQAEKLVRDGAAATKRNFSESREMPGFAPGQGFWMTALKTIGDPVDLTVAKVVFEQAKDGWVPTDVETDPRTGILTTALSQWSWMEEKEKTGEFGNGEDQFNKLNEVLLCGMKALSKTWPIMHAPFDPSDQSSACLAGYWVNLGLQTGVEIRPIVAGMLNDNGKGRPVDPSGTPVRYCLSAAIDDKTQFERAEWEGTVLATPQWFRAVRSALRIEGRLARATGANRACVWLVAGRAAALSFNVGDRNGILRSLPHVIAP